MKMTFRFILVGGLAVFFAVVAMVVFMPSMMSSPPTTVAHPYTDEQRAGRELFYSNGCIYCHTQYVRAEDTAMGPVSVRGNYTFDRPMLFGSERTGPDLSYIGRKRSEAWEIGHLRDPRAFSPLSIMPSFEFLSDGELKAVAAYLFALGDRVSQERMILPPPSYQDVSDPAAESTVAPEPADNANGWPSWRKAGLQEGKELFESRCLPCHGCAGNGLGSYAGTMAVTPADLTQEPFRSMPPEQWFWHVSEGLPGTLMPTWKASLSDTQLWSVIRYVRTMFSRPVMRDPLEGNPTGEYAGLTNAVESTYEVLDEGKAIFTRECMICHGDGGRGDGRYATHLEPPPPDFGDASYGTLFDPTTDDADYFWRISEGLPWTAMPAWKVHYSVEDRWKLVHYIRTFLTRTEFFPSGEAPGFEFPETYKSQSVPEGVSFERGRRSYAANCAHCHGLAGDGGGWNAQGLIPPPADLRAMAGMKVTADLEREHLAKITFGIPGGTMPVWGEFLPEAERWDLVEYIMRSFVEGRPTPRSALGDGAVSAEFAMLSEDYWLGAGHDISTQRGESLYSRYCSTCHGSDGAGDGPGTAGNASGSPAAFPSGLRLEYAMWRIWKGVPETTMYPFDGMLSEAEMWDLAARVRRLSSRSSAKGGGS